MIHGASAKTCPPESQAVMHTPQCVIRVKANPLKRKAQKQGWCSLHLSSSHSTQKWSEKMDAKDMKLSKCRIMYLFLSSEYVRLWWMQLCRVQLLSRVMMYCRLLLCVLLKVDPEKDSYPTKTCLCVCLPSARMGQCTVLTNVFLVHCFPKVY